jgi:2-iminobutanoate/2-iminopropanoate deaminase
VSSAPLHYSSMPSHDPAAVAAPIGGYTHGLEVPTGHRLLFISGQIPVRADGATPSDFDSQCEVVWDNVTAVLRSAGMGPEHLVKVTTFLSDRRHADANGRIRRERLGDHRPALTVIIAGIYDPAWLLEVEAVAAAPGGVVQGAGE